MINPFKKSYSSKELNLFRYLSKIKIFERLEYAEMAYFLPYLYVRTYKMNEVVFFRNDPSNALYLVKSGTVSLNIDIKERFEILTEVRSGNSFGENSLIENGRRIYTSIVISTEAEFYVIPKVNIHEIFNEHISVRAKMMTSLSEHFNSYNHNLFKSYKNSFGFFNLGQAYNDI